MQFIKRHGNIACLIVPTASERNVLFRYRIRLWSLLFHRVSSHWLLLSVFLMKCFFQNSSQCLFKLSARAFSVLEINVSPLIRQSRAKRTPCRLFFYGVITHSLRFVNIFLYKTTGISKSIHDCLRRLFLFLISTGWNITGF